MPNSANPDRLNGSSEPIPAKPAFKPVEKGKPRPWRHRFVQQIIDPEVREREQGFLIGYDRIARYCGMSTGTIRKWWYNESFPLAKLPDGRIVTSKPLIDQWLLVRMDLNRARPGQRSSDKKPAQSDVGAKTGS